MSRVPPALARLALPLTAILLSACSSAPDPSGAGGTGSAAAVFTIDNSLISESSGLARSQRSADLLWTHNDSGGQASAYAISTTGRYLGALRLTGALNLDWEDMASFTEAGQPSLLLADIGDNGAFRPFVTLYVVDEPDAAALSASQDLSALPRRTLTVLYPDGPRDAEAVAVDGSEGFIYLLSKRDAVPRLYRVPLAPLLPVQVAEALGEIAIPRAAAGAADPERFNWVTSMDFSDDAREIAVLTQDRVYVYRRAGSETIAAALQRGPAETLPVPGFSQAEAVSFARDGSLYLSSENLPAPLAHLPR